MARNPATEAMLTMQPVDSRRAGTAAWDRRKVPVRLTSMIRRQSSGSTSVIAAALPIPATLARMSSRPWVSTTWATAAAHEPSSVTSHRMPSAVGSRSAPHHDGPVLGQPPDHRRTDPAGGAGDEGDPAGQPR